MNGGGAPFCQRAAAPAHEDVLAQDAVRVLAVERLFPRASVPLCPWWTSRSAVALVGSPNSWRPRDMGRAARSLATQHAAVPLAGPPAAVISPAAACGIESTGTPRSGSLATCRGNRREMAA
jgi:hypothetical protein